ncbi:MAG TPA: hypothetical protein VK788_03050 [Terriglobales bacterium]|nr:hypothetical protein [Terriglobales bacterium]
MKKAMLFRVVIVLAAMIALSCVPQSALAQRGGGHGGGGGFHGGGGGFHGGGGGFHGGGGGAFRGGGGFSGGGRTGFVGGRSFGGFRGGGFNRGRGGFGWGGRGFGWGGRYWGGGYGYGWGWGFGFGWPYWGWGGSYPYGYYYGPGYYGYSPYYSYPYYGPSDDPAGYPDPNNGNDDPSNPNARPQPNQNGPARSWRPPVPGGGADPNYPNNGAAAAAPRGPVLSVDRMSVTPASYRASSSSPVHSTTERATIERATAQADAPLRPEVQRALQRLREMPPFAREREIETGRYRQFSPEEKQILRNGE